MADDAEKVAQTIKEHDDLLCAPDAVLSPDIFEACTSAVKLKNVDGSPAFRVKDVINKLSSGYVGYAAMASLVCQWLAMLERETPTTTEDAPEDAAGQEHDAHGHEYHFLSQVVKQNFRPECFQDILLNGGPPAWVAELIADPRGRDLIFQLASSHANPDPFLAWTIKHIIAAGYDTPVPLDRSSLSQPAASKSTQFCTVFDGHEVNTTHILPHIVQGLGCSYDSRGGHIANCRICLRRCEASG